MVGDRICADFAPAFVAAELSRTRRRAEIEEHIYGDDAELFSNAVESAISTLRRKLETPGGATLIHTRRGLGYVLEAASK